MESSNCHRKNTGIGRERSRTRTLKEDESRNREKKCDKWEKKRTAECEISFDLIRGGYGKEKERKGEREREKVA